MPGCIAPTLHSPLALLCADSLRGAGECAGRVAEERFEPDVSLVDRLSALGDDAPFDPEGRVLGVEDELGKKGGKGRMGRIGRKGRSGQEGREMPERKASRRPGQLSRSCPSS